MLIVGTFFKTQPAYISEGVLEVLTLFRCKGVCYGGRFWYLMVDNGRVNLLIFLQFVYFLIVGAEGKFFGYFFC